MAAAAPAEAPRDIDGDPELLLKVNGLTVCYTDDRGRDVNLVEDVSFHLKRGEALGLAGESGCGKTTTALALLGLLPKNLRRAAGTIELRTEDKGVIPIHRRTERGMRPIRWANASIVFQGAMNALDPVMRIEDQIAEAIRLHEPGIDKAGVRERVQELFGFVGVNPARSRQYPHEFSGGMRQRVMIALALACKPELIIGDEPTTALDVMMQAQILELLEELRRELGLAMILITHDLSVLAETCDRVAIMYAGQIAETGTVKQLYHNPQHPYTQRLLAALPVIGGHRELAPAIPGVPPDPRRKAEGCLFAPRCHMAKPECSSARIEMKPVDGRHEARCRFAPWAAGALTPLAVPDTETAAPAAEEDAQ